MALTLRLHAAGHQRRLGGVEARDSAAGHRDEHETPDGLAGGLHVVEVGPQLGDDVVGVGHDAEADAHRHDDQADAEDGVNFADDLVDGQEGGDEVVGQNDPQPELGAGDNAGEAAVLEQGDDQAGGTDCKDGADHDQQHDAEYAHDVLHAVAEVDAADLRDGSAVVTLGQHTREIVVDAAGEDGAEGDPQEHHRPPQSALHGAEDGAQTCNVQQLNQEQFPLRHHDVVNAVVDADRRGFPVIRPEGVVDHFTIGQVANNKESQTDQKTNHTRTSSKYFSGPGRSLPQSGRPSLF